MDWRPEKSGAPERSRRPWELAANRRNQRHLLASKLRRRILRCLAIE
jgi:hypothetical protein